MYSIAYQFRSPPVCRVRAVVDCMCVCERCECCSCVLCVCSCVRVWCVLHVYMCAYARVLTIISSEIIHIILFPGRFLCFMTSRNKVRTSQDAMAKKQNFKYCHENQSRNCVIYEIAG